MPAERGACVQLDGKSRIDLLDRNNHLKSVNGERCFAHLDVNGTDHAI